LETKHRSAVLILRAIRITILHLTIPVEAWCFNQRKIYVLPSRVAPHELKISTDLFRKLKLHRWTALNMMEEGG
jgi:hypothetical protein